MKRILALILCLTLLAPALTGCNTEEQPYTPTGNGLTWDEDYTGNQDQTEQTPSNQSLQLTFYPNKTMNPYTCTDFTNRALFGLLYQSLFSVDRDYRIEPQLCKRFQRS